MNQQLKDNIIAQIGYELGVIRMGSGDHVANRQTILDLSKQFYDLHRNIDWDKEDLTLKIEKFLASKKRNLITTPATVVIAISGGIADVAYQDEGIRTIIVDHDNADTEEVPEDHEPGVYSDPVNEIGKSTRTILKNQDLLPEGA